METPMELPLILRVRTSPAGIKRPVYPHICEVLGVSRRLATKVKTEVEGDAIRKSSAELRTRLERRYGSTAEFKSFKYLWAFTE